jgi:tripartite-type tricarboxylate transporter receptor subunit TctC
MVHVPYRGAGLMVDTIAGNVPSMFDSLGRPTSAGKVRALAVSGEAQPRLPRRADDEGQAIPASSPIRGSASRCRQDARPIVDRLAECRRAEETGRGQALEIGAGQHHDPAEVTRFIQAEIDKWTPVVKASGAKPD